MTGMHYLSHGPQRLVACLGMGGESRCHKSNLSTMYDQGVGARNRHVSRGNQMGALALDGGTEQVRYGVLSGILSACLLLCRYDTQMAWNWNGCYSHFGVSGNLVVPRCSWPESSPWLADLMGLAGPVSGQRWLMGLMGYSH